MIAFTARAVAATNLPHLNTRIVVLAEESEGDGGPRLEISRALVPTKQDRELGHDTYCLSTQTGATIYGGVRSYTLQESTLTMRIVNALKSMEDMREAVAPFANALKPMDNMRHALDSVAPIVNAMKHTDDMHEALTSVTNVMNHTLDMRKALNPFADVMKPMEDLRRSMNPFVDLMKPMHDLHKATNMFSRFPFGRR